MKINMEEEYTICNLPNYPVITVGDIHGEFNPFFFFVKQFTKTIFIVCGDCGFGFYKTQYYKDILKTQSRKLLENSGNYIIFFRGNHDDPSYFNGKNRIQYSNIKTIPDYSILNIGNLYKILCIGGGMSIDRLDRIKTWEITTKKYGKPNNLYWENEKVSYNPKALDKITFDKHEINCVCSHSAPIIAPPEGIGKIVSYYAALDATLIDELMEEREHTIMDIYTHLAETNKQPIKTWCYGHFHSSDNMIYTNTKNGLITKFVMLDMLRGVTCDHYVLYDPDRK